MSRFEDLAGRRRSFSEPFRRRRGRDVGLAFDHGKLDRRPIRPEADDVAVLQQRVTGNPLAVDESAVAAAEVLQDKPFRLVHDRGMARRDVQIALRVEADVGQGVTAKTDIAFAERVDLPRAGSGQKLELGFHRFRLKYQTMAAITAIAASRMRRVLGLVFSRLGTGGRLPL